MAEFVSFTTDGLELADRVDAVEQALGDTHTAVAIETPAIDGPAEGRLVAHINSTPLGAMRLASFELGFITITRKEELLRDGDDNFSLLACTSGSLFVTPPGRKPLRVAPGMAALVSHQQVTSVEADQLSSLKTLIMPRELVRRVLRDPEQAVGAAPAGGFAAMGLLAGYMDRLLAEPEVLAPKLQCLVEGHILDLLANAYNPNGEWNRAAPNAGVIAARRQSVLDLLSQTFGQADASAETFGRKLGISTRLVHQLLEETGKTFTEHLLELRLQAALRMLQSPSAAGMRIMDIAYAAGFSDVSYFNRRFRRRFGDTPVSFR